MNYLVQIKQEVLLLKGSGLNEHLENKSWNNGNIE